EHRKHVLQRLLRLPADVADRHQVAVRPPRHLSGRADEPAGGGAGRVRIGRPRLEAEALGNELGLRHAFLRIALCGTEAGRRARRRGRRRPPAPAGSRHANRHMPPRGYFTVSTARRLPSTLEKARWMRNAVSGFSVIRPIGAPSGTTSHSTTLSVTVTP